MPSRWTSIVVALAFSLGAAFAQKPVNIEAEKKELARLEKMQVAAKTAYSKSPKDSKKKKSYIDLSLTLANNVQASMALSSKEKYPKALRIYRAVLSIDAKNKEAIENRDRIESIYRSMGRPIPK